MFYSLFYVNYTGRNTNSRNAFQFISAQLVKTLLPMQETQEMCVWSLGQEKPLKKEMATCSSILAWKIPWTEEPGRKQSMGLQRIRHDWAHGTHTLLVPSNPELFICNFILFLSFMLSINLNDRETPTFTIFSWVLFNKDFLHKKLARAAVKSSTNMFIYFFLAHFLYPNMIL